MSKHLIAIKALGAWFQQNQRILPWRDQPTFYRVWISEIMLQQTQVATVLPYFEKFIAKFPTVETLAAAPVEDVLLSWAGLGYYSRARNLHQAAQLIVARGGFPETREEWLEIPGVGPYTAGAILSVTLNKVEAILDGNVERVLSRVFRVDRGRGDSVYKARLWRWAWAAVRGGVRVNVPPNQLNQALMELGATFCSYRKPKCELCPLSSVCRAYGAGEPEAYPPKKKPKQWVKVEERLHCVLDGSGRVLLRKRGKDEWRADLWDLLEENPYKNAEKIGEQEQRYVVTRHKVSRVVEIWKTSRVLKAAEAGVAVEGSQLQWVSLQSPEVPMGSPLRKLLQTLN
jgi:A/G-specific adenine glycosylase